VVASKPVDSRARIEAELAYARAARRHGKEGRARVSARRAAGWAIAAQFPENRQRDAYSHLRWLEGNAEVSRELRSAAGRLTEQVKEDHELPHPEDPLEDAGMIVVGLLGDDADRDGSKREIYEGPTHHSRRQTVNRYVDVGSDQAPLAFRLRMPQDNQAVPVVMLHGLGGDETAMWNLESVLPQAGMVVAPRAPYQKQQGGYAWNPTIKTWPPSVSEFAEAVALLEGLFDYLEIEYGFQRHKMILMGFSNGTVMSFAASMIPMSRLPLGIIAISGLVPQGDPSPLKGIPVYWAHGTKDTFIPIDMARSDADRLRRAEVPITYCEAEVGHKLGTECFKNLKSWLQDEFPAPELSDQRTAQRAIND